MENAALDQLEITEQTSERKKPQEQRNAVVARRLSSGPVVFPFLLLVSLFQFVISRSDFQGRKSGRPSLALISDTVSYANR